jgi:hypothetical protein
MPRLIREGVASPVVPGFVLQAPVAPRAAGRARRPLAPAVRDAVARSATLHRGLAFLHRGPVECVAAALGVPVRVVEHARACLDGVERPLLLEVHAVARELLRPPRAAPPLPSRHSRGPEDVLREAHHHRLGVDFLMSGHLEAVAVAYGVHPEVVLAARQLGAVG